MKRTNCVSRSAKLRATLAVLCLVIVGPLQIAGQKRAPAVAAKVTPTPDALVFSDRNWVYCLSGGEFISPAQAG